MALLPKMKKERKNHNDAYLHSGNQWYGWSNTESWQSWYLHIEGTGLHIQELWVSGITPEINELMIMLVLPGTNVRQIWAKDERELHCRSVEQRSIQNYVNEVIKSTRNWSLKEPVYVANFFLISTSIILEDILIKFRLFSRDWLWLKKINCLEYKHTNSLLN